jgi:RNA polymerase sigma-70 factor (family 1)
MSNNDGMLLLQRLRNGEVRAYEEIFMKYYKALTAEAFFYLKDEMEAEDLVQLLFIEIWDKQLYLKIDTSIKAYLHTATRNRCLSVIEKKKTQHKRFNEYIRSLDDKITANPVERAEQEHRVNAVLNELPSQRLKAFNLVYVENKRYKEAAEEMGITINSIKTHLKLALKILQQKFEGFR